MTPFYIVSYQQIKGGVTMELFLKAVPIIPKYSVKQKVAYYSQIIPGIICQSLYPLY